MRTLCIEVVPSYLRAVVVDGEGRALSDRRRVELRRSAAPNAMLDALDELLVDMGVAGEESRDHRRFERASIAFGGIVRDGAIVTAPGFIEGWQGVRLTGAIEFRLGVPTRAASDADVLGLAVIEGNAIEMALTLGTRVGTALFVDGRRCPSLNFGSQPLSDNETYDDRLGNTARKRIGNDKWNRRLLVALKQLQPIFNYARIYLGGPNADKVDVSRLPTDTRLVEPSSALRGGVGLWAERQA